uniref:Uncharacterized protein At5g65660 n=1 Tax=Rhizophora mucronata TaxID=61149 RepID=A0A2P2JFM3_RHIMU
MESPNFSPPHVDASRPSLGFPLGTAMLLFIIFTLSGIFSCCYHWDKLRSLRRSFSEDSDPGEDIESSPPHKSKSAQTVTNFPNLEPNCDEPRETYTGLCPKFTLTLPFDCFVSIALEAKARPKHASTDAWRPNSKVYSIAMSMSAPAIRKACPRRYKAT